MTIVGMQPRGLLQIFKTAVKRWIERDAFEHAAALAFCTLFSLAPLVIIIVAVVGIVLIIGFLMLTSFVVSLGITGAIEYAREWVPIPGSAVMLIDLAVSLAVTTVLFGMLFKVLPDIIIRWADVWRGAFITALLFAIGKYCISLYLTHVAPASTFGAAGSLVLIL